MTRQVRPLAAQNEVICYYIIKGAIEKGLKLQKWGLPELIIEARTLSSHVPLIKDWGIASSLPE